MNIFGNYDWSWSNMYGHKHLKKKLSSTHQGVCSLHTCSLGKYSTMKKGWGGHHEPLSFNSLRLDFSLDITSPDIIPIL